MAANGTTDADGKIRFTLLEMIIHPNEEEYLGNYTIKATYNNLVGEERIVLDASKQIHINLLHAFIIRLKKGWNMISLPLHPTISDPNELFKDIDYFLIYSWNTTAYKYEKPFEIKAGEGYWIFVLEDANVTVLGFPIDEYSINLTKGWNMIGSIWNKASLSAEPDYAILGYAYTWDPTGQRYVQDTTLNPGKAYWIFAFEDCRLKIKPA